MDGYFKLGLSIDVDFKLINSKNNTVKWTKSIHGTQENSLKRGVLKEYEEIISKATTNALKNAQSAFASDSFSTALNIDR